MRLDETMGFLIKDLKPVTALSGVHMRLAKWCLCLFLAVVVGIYYYSIRPNFSAVVATPRFIIESLSLLLSIVFGVLTILKEGVPGQSWSRNRLIFLLSFAVWVGSLAMSFILGVNSSSIIAIPALSQICIVIVTSINILPVSSALLMASKNRFHKLASPVLILALAASLSGAFAIQFICPASDVMHIVFWHGLPALFTAIVSVMLGVFVFKRS